MKLKRVYSGINKRYLKDYKLTDFIKGFYFILKY